MDEPASSATGTATTVIGSETIESRSTGERRSSSSSFLRITASWLARLGQELQPGVLQRVPMRRHGFDARAGSDQSRHDLRNRGARLDQERAALELQGVQSARKPSGWNGAASSIRSKVSRRISCTAPTARR